MEIPYILEDPTEKLHKLEKLMDAETIPKHKSKVEEAMGIKDERRLL
jgi:hypothetical protein